AQDRASLLLRNLDVPKDALTMSNGGQRSHFSGRIHRVSDPNRFCQREKTIEELVRNLFLHQQARSCDASLPLIVEDRERRSVHRGFQQRIIKHDVGALAPELELNPFQISGSELRTQFPARKHQWKVPGHNLPDHTNRLTRDVIEESRLNL